MRFELPMPKHLRPRERVKGEELASLKWSRIGQLYRHQDRRRFDTFIASITRKRADRIRERVPNAKVAGKIQTRAQGIADFLIENEMASPRGFAMTNVMDAYGIQTYLNVEAIWRKDPGIKFTNGEWRRERITERYLEDLETLRCLKNLGARSIEEVLSEQRSDEMRRRLEKAYRTALCRGDLTFESDHPGLAWEGLRRMTLAMGSVSETQYGLMVPDASQKQVTEQFATLTREHKLDLIPGEDPDLPARYVVSNEEAELALRLRELTWEEWDQAACKRQLQRDHDEAVGDALLLIAYVANEYGTGVREVVPESKLIALGVPSPVPDFAVELRDHFGLSSLSCEVIGKGGGYRQSSFKKSQAKAGHLVYHPPYLGGGAYFQ